MTALHPAGPPEPVAADHPPAGDPPSGSAPRPSRRRGGARGPRHPGSGSRATGSRPAPRPAPPRGVRVDLLPPEIRAARRGHRARRIALAALAVTAVILAAVCVVARTGVADARSELADADSLSASLRAQQGRYTDVLAQQQRLRDAAARFTEVAGTDLAWAPVLTGVRAVVPAGVVVTTVDAQAATGTAAPTAPAAAASGAAGSITVTGTATDPVAVAAYVDALGTVPGLDAVVATGVAALATGGYSYGVAAVVTTAALRAVPSAGPVK